MAPLAFGSGPWDDSTIAVVILVLIARAKVPDLVKRTGRR